VRGEGAPELSISSLQEMTLRQQKMKHAFSDNTSSQHKSVGEKEITFTVQYI
jgi:hypothetical protein